MLGASSCGNALAAMHQTLTASEMAALGAIAPVVACVTAHILLLLTAPDGTTPKHPVGRAKRSSAGSPVGGSNGVPVVGNSAVDVKGRAPKSDRAAILTQIAEHRLTTGAWPSGPTVAGDWLGGSVSRKTGSRLVATARAAAGE